MPAGWKYEKKIEGTMPEMCDYSTAYRLPGGFNLVLDNLTGVTAIPPCTPLVVDFKARTATAIVNVTVHETISAGATTLKVKKGSLVYPNIHLGNGTNGGTVKGVDKTNAEYDVITLDGTPTLVAKAGDVLFEATAVAGKIPKVTANALNYAWCKVEQGATVTAMGAVYDIKPSKLIAPVSDKDKESLGSRFLFTY